MSFNFLTLGWLGAKRTGERERTGCCLCRIIFRTELFTQKQAPRQHYHITKRGAYSGGCNFSHFWFIYRTRFSFAPIINILTNQMRGLYVSNDVIYLLVQIFSWSSVLGWGSLHLSRTATVWDNDKNINRSGLISPLTVPLQKPGEEKGSYPSLFS